MEEAKESQATDVENVSVETGTRSAIERIKAQLLAQFQGVRARLPLLLKQPKVLLIAGGVTLAVVLLAGGISIWSGVSAKNAAKAKEAAEAKAKAKAEKEAKAAAEKNAPPAMAPDEIMKAHAAILAAGLPKPEMNSTDPEKADAESGDGSRDALPSRAADSVQEAPAKIIVPPPRPSVANTAMPPEVVAAPPPPAPEPTTRSGSNSGDARAAGSCVLDGKGGGYGKALGECLQEFSRMEGRR